MLTTSNSFGQCEIDYTNPKEVGLFVLNAIKDTNVTALKCTLNQTNQDYSGDLKEFIISQVHFTEGVIDITEIRKHERRNGEVWIHCKLKAVDHEMMVITLTLENGKYLFEDISSPSISEFEELELFEIINE